MKFSIKKHKELKISIIKIINNQNVNKFYKHNITYNNPKP